MKAHNVSLAGCGDCLCRSCMLWWSSRCPHGECYDEYRAKVNPYDKAHPNDPPRTLWSNWKSEQAYWCRGGITYPQQICERFVRYEGSEVKSCLLSNVQVFQDGYIQCSIIDSIGCKECYQRFAERQAAKETVEVLKDDEIGVMAVAAVKRVCTLLIAHGVKYRILYFRYPGPDGTIHNQAAQNTVQYLPDEISSKPIKVLLSYKCKRMGKGVRFERIRRITGYLVGTLDKWNDAKKAEERDRVKHSMARGHESK